MLLSSLLWVILFTEKSWPSAKAIEVSKSRHNSRTKLCIELSLVHIRDNTELYLHCKFQSSLFSVRCKIGVTDRQNDWQTTRLQYASWLRPPRHNDHPLRMKYTAHWPTKSMLLAGNCPCHMIIYMLLCRSINKIVLVVRAYFVAITNENTPTKDVS